MKEWKREKMMPFLSCTHQISDTGIISGGSHTQKARAQMGFWNQALIFIVITVYL